MTSLLAIGIGAAAYSMSNRRTKQKMNQMIEPIMKMDLNKWMNTRAWKKMQRNITRAFS